MCSSYTTLFVYIYIPNHIPKLMYKYLLYCFTFLYSSMLSAQENYTDFSVNKKYGVVNTQNLEEMVVPFYTKEVLFSDAYLGFENDNALEFYDKTTGKLLQYSKAEQQYHLYVKTKEYLHITTKENRSALIDQQLKVAATFPYMYSSINAFLFTPFIIARSVNGFDVYNTRQSPFKLLHKHIKATDYSIIKILNKEKEFEYYAVFYGKETVYIYTEDFSLLKTIPAHAATEKEAITVLKSYYNVDEGLENFDPPLATETGNWYLVRKENGCKIYESQSYSNLYVKVKDRFDVTAEWMDEVKVYDNKTKEMYIFKLDRAAKKALIPLKYQQLMGLEIVEKK